MNNTAKQLVAQLGDNAEITIMSDIVHGLDFEYEQLQQENKKLKEENKRAYAKYINCRKTESKFEYILTEFEKWLEEEIKKENKQFDFCFSKETQCRQIEHIGYLEFVLKKLQKLKEGKK